jgi:DNA polymerase IV
LKVKYADFQIITRSRSDTDIVPDHVTLMQVSLDLLAQLVPTKNRVLLLGTSLSSLRPKNAVGSRQMMRAL